MRILFFAIILSFSHTATSQSYLERSKKHITKSFRKIAKKDSLISPILFDQDSVLVVDFNGTQEIMFTYYFDEKQICQKSKAEFDCDRCVESFVDGIFNEKWMGWMQISENKYMSSWFRGTFLTINYSEVPGEGVTFVFDVLRNKNAYDKLKAEHEGKEIKYGRN